MYSLCSLRSHIAPNSHVSYPVILADVRYVYRDSSELTQEDFCAFLVRYSFDNVRTCFTKHTRQRRGNMVSFQFVVAICLDDFWLLISQQHPDVCCPYFWQRYACVKVFFILLYHIHEDVPQQKKYIHIHNTLHFFIYLCTVHHLRVSHCISSRFSLVDYQYARFVVGIFHRCGHISIMLLAFSHSLPLLLFFLIVIFFVVD